MYKIGRVNICGANDIIIIPDYDVGNLQVLINCLKIYLCEYPNDLNASQLAPLSLRQLKIYERS